MNYQDMKELVEKNLFSDDKVEFTKFCFDLLNEEQKEEFVEILANEGEIS